MIDIFVVTDLNGVKTKECVRCGYSGSKKHIDSHHITYNPEEKIYLCRDCHIGITALNVEYSLRVGRLSNADRKRLHRNYMRRKWRFSDEELVYVTFKMVRNDPYILKKLFRRSNG